MPRKIENTTKAHLISVALPNHAATYTVISHQFVIDYATQALNNAGFNIMEEEYRCSADGQIAQGIYKLNFNNDPELSMMFAWTNSYNKQVKFKCVVGAYLNYTGSVMISGEVGSWIRKHTGTADVETKKTIDAYVANANMYYEQLCYDKSVMNTLVLNKRRQAQLLGVLFAEYCILTTEQASVVRDFMKNPPAILSNNDTMWAFYNYVTIALQSSHPKTWMEDQRILHYFIGTICDFSKPLPQPTVVEETPAIVDPLLNNYGQPENQTNLLMQIAEVTGDDSVLEPQLSNNQVVQEEVETEPVLNQFEEVVEEVNEAEELPFDIDADAMLDTMLVPIETEAIDFHNTVVQEETEITAEEELLPPGLLDEAIMKYTDSAGNTFETSNISPCTGHDLETTKDIEEEVEIANLDEINVVKEPVIEEANLTSLNSEDLNSNDGFDLDFGDVESETDNTPDFF
jgi:hypothetical protein